jgi:hypothetical protein
MKAALYGLHYIHSTFDFGISFTSDLVAPMYLYIHHPPSTDVEAYVDAVPSMPTTSPTISAYSDICWGSQIGSAVADIRNPIFVNSNHWISTIFVAKAIATV